MRKAKFFSNNKKELIVAMLVVLTICLLIVIEMNIFYKGLNSYPQKADVIIVLGCSVWRDVPSPALYERIYKAFELYRDGYAKEIIASGAKGEGENVTEATEIKEQLIRLGVKPEDIIEEDKSTNTIENLSFTKKIMQKKGFKRSIVVTNYFHIYRCSMIASDLKINSTFAKANMPDSLPYLVSSNLRELLSVTKYYLFNLFERFINKQEIL